MAGEGWGWVEVFYCGLVGFFWLAGFSCREDGKRTKGLTPLYLAAHFEGGRADVPLDMTVDSIEVACCEGELEFFEFMLSCSLLGGEDRPSLVDHERGGRCYM